MQALQNTQASKITRLIVRLLVLLNLLGAGFAALAQAPVIYAVNGSNRHLISFRANAPGTLLSDVVLSGLGPFTQLVGIDVRPATGVLYGVATDSSNVGRLVTINTNTGAATQVGSTLPVDTFAYYGMSFDPVADRIRLVSSTRNNWRFNPEDGLPTNDRGLAYAADDPNAVNSPSVVHLANTNSFAGATVTTAYGIDYGLNLLVRLGGLNGAPLSPNGGELVSVGALGVSMDSRYGGFDIEAGSNTAYAALRVGGLSRLYTISLASGAATLVGVIGNGMDVVDGMAIASVPSSCLDLDGDGVALPLTDGLMMLRALLGLTGTAVTNGALPVPSPPRPTWAAIRAHMNANCGMHFGP